MIGDNMMFVCSSRKTTVMTSHVHIPCSHFVQSLDLKGPRNNMKILTSNHFLIIVFPSFVCICWIDSA